MAIGQYRDIENGERNTGNEDLEKPFIDQHNKRVDESEEDESETSSEKGSIGMVLLSTAVAVCGSFEFGSCVGFSSPTQSDIRADLNLSLSEYSMFGSILTIGAMIAAVTSGRISDSIGRKGAMRLSAVCCIAGWLAVYFAMMKQRLPQPRHARENTVSAYRLMVAGKYTDAAMPKSASIGRERKYNAQE